MKVQKYLDQIKADYAKWSTAAAGDVVDRQVADQMVKEFKAKIRVEPGKKYLKVISGSGVHSFILIKDDGKFRKGDVLKAASWEAPARNFARGNILDGTAKPNWAGA